MKHRPSSMNRKRQNDANPSPEDIKFLVDASLARLAKWLRLLGYDTAVFGKEAGRVMMRQAEAEDRVLLTRRRDMIERQFSGTLFLITDVSAGKQLHAVIERFSLDVDRQKMFRICLECNEKLSAVEKEDVRDLVPPYVFENCTQYNQCPRCQKIYWMGTHPRNAMEFMKRHIPIHLP